MYACGLPEVHADHAQAHCVFPETLAQCRGRIDQDLMDTLVPYRRPRPWMPASSAPPICWGHLPGGARPATRHRGDDAV